MNKQWLKYFLLLGTVIMLVLSLAIGFTLVRGNLAQAEDKEVFQSIYKDTDIDFIVPSPSADQVANLNGNADAGIENITPYYMTNSEVTIDGEAKSGAVFLFPDASKMSVTPYNSARVISGNMPEQGQASIDSIYAEKNECKIGDTAKVEIAGNTIEAEIVSIVYPNTYEQEGTIAFVLGDDSNKLLEAGGAIYSAAYIKANDLQKCEQYLYHDYKPYGRLKKKSDFDSADTYSKHEKNFNEADWSKEITNCRKNYDSLSIKYTNVDRSILMNQVVAALIAIITVVVLAEVLLHSAALFGFMKAFLIKKSGTVDRISQFYVTGLIWNFLTYAVFSCVVYFVLVNSSILHPISASILNLVIPVCTAFLSTIIMIAVAKRYVSQVYVIIKKKHDEEEASKREKANELEKNEGIHQKL